MTDGLAHPPKEPADRFTGLFPRREGIRRLTMANVEVKKVEGEPNHRVLFSVRVTANTGKMEFPIGIQDQGSAAANEAAVLTSTLGLAEELAASARLQLGPGTRR
jgi:hypothetical protein